MTFRKLKNYCDEKIKEFPQYEKKYKKEIIFVKRFYSNDINLYEEFEKNKEKIKTQYIIPFLLGFTDKVTDEDWEYKFVKTGSSGGIDIDVDFDPVGKQKIQDYLFEKYGEEKVLHVGTFNRLGPASAAKDLLRVYKVDFKESNDFTKRLDSKMSWQENLDNLKENFPVLYQFYENHKEILDLTPHFINKIRQGGSHAGGIVILDAPVYDRIPVDKVSGNLVTAFPESAQEQTLDEMGVVKFDILAISILDVIRNAINMIEEKLFLIEEDDVKKIVSKSYLDKEIEKF